MTQQNLVGREEERALCAAAISRVGGGDPASVVVAGPAGIGKTALIADLCGAAGRAGFRVVRGSATEFEQEVPFAPVVDALDDVFEELGAAWLGRLDAPWQGELASVFPALSGRGTDLDARLPAERYRCYRAVSAAIEALADQDPVLLALDDLHWADPASLELVCHLLHRGPRARVLLALAYRERASIGPLAGAVAVAERERRVDVLRPRPLSETDVDALLGADLGEAARRIVHSQGGGNPFFVGELARALRAGAPSVAPAGDVPGSVSTTARWQLAECSERALVVAETAAVLGDSFDPAVVAAVARLGEEEALHAIDELVELDVLHAAEGAHRFAFRHPLVRRAIYESCGEGFRLGSHERAASVLKDRAAPMTTIAHHVERSARPGDEAAIALLSEAGSRAGARAPAAAARWFGGALRLLASGDTRRPSLLLAHAHALAASDQPDESEAVFAELLALTPEDQPLLRARLLGARARFEHMRARHSHAHAALEEALAGARDDPALHAALTLERTIDIVHTRGWAGVAEWAGRARAEAQAIDERILYVAATAHLALRAYRGEIAEARRHADEAAALVDPLSDEELALRVEALLALTLAEWAIDRYDDAVRHAQRTLTVIRKTGQSAWFSISSSLLGVAHLGRGHLDEAAAACDAALASAELGRGDEERRHRALSVLAYTNRLRGDHDAALRTAEAALEIEQAYDSELVFGLYARCEVGAALIATGRIAEGRHRILAAAGDDLGAMDIVYRPEWCRILALADLAAGDAAAADRWVARADTTAAKLDLPAAWGMAHMARAALTSARGDAAAALDLAGRARARFASVGRNLEAGRARLLEGQLLAELGDRSAAATALIDAHAELDACGAVRDRDEAERAVNRLGRRFVRRPATPATLDVLTAREAEIAQLVTEGLTNREIAKRLHLSERTVEKHLTRVFGKLGVASRAEVARVVAAAERGAVL